MKLVLVSFTLFFSRFCFAFPDTDLKFLCVDSFHETSSTFELKRLKDYSWSASHSEVSSAGILIATTKNLIAAIDEQDRLVLNLNKKIYALFIRTNSNEAIYRDGKRIMNCTFS
jgi:hypothetical protein